MKIDLLPAPRFTPLEIVCGAFILLCVGIIFWVELHRPQIYCWTIRPKPTIPGQLYALGRLERQGDCDLFEWVPVIELSR